MVASSGSFPGGIALLLGFRFHPDPVPIPCLVWQWVRFSENTSCAIIRVMASARLWFSIWSAADSVLGGVD